MAFPLLGHVKEIRFLSRLGRCRERNRTTGLAYGLNQRSLEKQSLYRTFLHLAMNRHMLHCDDRDCFLVVPLSIFVAKIEIFRACRFLYERDMTIFAGESLPCEMGDHEGLMTAKQWRLSHTVSPPSGSPSLANRW